MLMTEHQAAEVLAKAIHLALNAHATQFRRDGVTPYYKHLQDVAMRVGDDVELQAIAWLHDVIEDHPDKYTADTLRQQGMPEHVVQAVLTLTKQPGEPYQQFVLRAKANPLARKVKIADILSNLADTPTDRQIVKYAKALLVLVDA